MDRLPKGLRYGTPFVDQGMYANVSHREHPKLSRGEHKTWRTELTAYGEKLGEVKIRRRIFQGENLSPLIIILSMIQLSLVLLKIGIGYE